MSVLLAQQPAPVTRRQRRLTARFLLPVQAALADLLRALRAETDRALAGTLPQVAGQAYPFGRCREITEDVTARLRARLVAVRAAEGANARTDAGATAGATAGASTGSAALKGLSGFLAEGGIVRPIWGALRGRYFQNALQAGGLYLDVANDTVTVTKPKIEILPLQESGFEALRGPGHFAEVAALYWGATLYANHALPALAPVLPLISHVPGAAPRLQSATDYMIDLLRADGFAQSEAWLAEGPVPPPALVEALQARARERLGWAAPAAGAAAAVTACREARAAGRQRDAGWRDDRVREYLRLQAPAGASGAAGAAGADEAPSLPGDG